MRVSKLTILISGATFPVMFVKHKEVGKPILSLKQFTEKFVLLVFHEWGSVIARTTLEDTWCYKDWNYSQSVDVFVNIKMDAHT